MRLLRKVFISRIDLNNLGTFFARVVEIAPDGHNGVIDH